AATARAAASAGTVMCLSTIATATPADVAAAAPGAPRWFQLYVFKDWGLTSALVQQAADAGYSALVLTADTPYLGRREGPLRTGFAIPDDVRIPAVDTARGGGLQPFSLHEHFDLFSPAVSWRDVERLTDLSGLAVGGEEAARHVLELLRDEIRLALSLLGCTSPAEIRREHVAPAP